LTGPLLLHYGRSVKVLGVIGCAIAVASGVLALAHAAPGEPPRAAVAAERVYFPSHCGASKYRPRTIVMACGDAGFIIEHITWQRWRRKGARGSGTGVTKTCDPFCAAGGIEKNPIAVWLWRPVRCKDNGRLQFTRLRYVFGGAGPSIGPRSDKQRFGCGF